MLRAFLAEEDPRTKKTYGERVVKALVHGAIKGKPVAVQQLWDRVEGKVTQNVSIGEAPKPTRQDIKDSLRKRRQA